jgi:hypothetical protein
MPYQVRSFQLAKQDGGGGIMVKVYTSPCEHIIGKKIKHVKLTLVIDAYGQEYVLINDNVEEKMLYKLHPIGKIIRIDDEIKTIKQVGL